MKLRNLFFALLALPLAFAACEPEPTPEPQPEPGVKPQLILTSDDVMNFKADGGNGTIEYTLVNAKEGTEFTHECEAEWISNFAFGEDITFEVAANDGDARTAKITIKYDTQSFDVTVNQEAKKNTSVPAINITSENPMTLDHNEQMGAVTYTIDNPIEGVKLTAQCSAEWISQVAVQEANNKVVFQVAANSGDAREAVIALTYGLLEQNVTIKQSEYVELPAEIDVVSELSVAAEGGAQSIEYAVENKKEGVELTATCEDEWITNLAVGANNITFDVAAYEGDTMRSAVIALAYGDVTAQVAINQLPAGANPDTNYLTFGIVAFKAEPVAADWWNIIMTESDPTLGNMTTRISVKLAEGNAMYITDGTYSVANGGVLINSYTVNDYSTYRYNTSGEAYDIIDATVEVTNNIERESSTIKGSFTVGNNIISFQYRGKVDGFMYEEISDEGITEWTKFTTRYGWDDAYVLNAATSSVTIELRIHELGVSKSNHGTCPSPGEYIVSDKSSEYNWIEKESSFGFINGNNLESGKLVVEDAGNGQTTITFDIIDEFGTQWKGSYTGAL